MKAKKSQTIEAIRKRFHREWLLIAVDKIDHSTTTVTHGRLLAHSKSRDEIYEEMLRRKGPKYVTHSDHRLPRGYGYAL